MKTTINNKEITLRGNKISFLNDETGLETEIIPRNLVLNIETGTVSVQAVAKHISPTDMVMSEVQIGTLSLNFQFAEIEAPAFQAKYLNALFGSLMVRFGLGADQVISEETGEVEVIERESVTPPEE